MYSDETIEFLKTATQPEREIFVKGMSAARYMDKYLQDTIKTPEQLVRVMEAVDVEVPDTLRQIVLQREIKSKAKWYQFWLL